MKNNQTVELKERTKKPKKLQQLVHKVKDRDCYFRLY